MCIDTPSTVKSPVQTQSYTPLGFPGDPTSIPLPVPSWGYPTQESKNLLQKEHKIKRRVDDCIEDEDSFDIPIKRLCLDSRKSKNIENSTWN
jgi:hypothetical protein